MPRRVTVCALVVALAIAGCGTLRALGRSQSCESETTDAVAAWGHYVAAVAELRVIQQYPQSDANMLAIYVAAAQAYYAREYQLQLAGDASRPAQAAGRTLQAAWRPGR